MWPFSVGFHALPVFAQVIATTTTANTNAATTSSPKCVGYLVSDSLPSFFWTAVLPLDADACLKFSYCPLHAPGLLFLYFSVYILRGVCSHFFLSIHFTHSLIDFKNVISAKSVCCVFFTAHFLPQFSSTAGRTCCSYLYAALPHNCKVKVLSIYRGLSAMRAQLIFLLSRIWVSVHFG